MAATASWFRLARKLNPPESRTSTSARLVRSGLPSTYALGKPFGSCHRRRRRLSHFVNKLGQVAVRFLEKRLASQLRANRALQELGCWESALLDSAVQLVRKINLQPRHTPNHTPNCRLRPHSRVWDCRERVTTTRVASRKHSRPNARKRTALRAARESGSLQAHRRQRYGVVVVTASRPLRSSIGRDIAVQSLWR